MSELAKSIARNVENQGKSKKARLSIESNEFVESIGLEIIDAVQSGWNSYSEIKASESDKELILKCKIIRSEEEEDIEDQINDIKDALANLDIAGSDEPVVFDRHKAYLHELDQLNLTLKALRTLRVYYFFDQEKCEDIKVGKSVLKALHSGKTSDWAYEIPIKDFEDDDIEEALELFGKGEINDHSKSILVGTSYDKMIKARYSDIGLTIGKAVLHGSKSIFSGLMGLYRQQKLHAMIKQIPNPVESEYLSRISQGNDLEETKKHFRDYKIAKNAGSFVNYLRRYGSPDEKQIFVEETVQKLDNYGIDALWGNQIRQINVIKKTPVDLPWSQIKDHLIPEFTGEGWELLESVGYYLERFGEHKEKSKILMAIEEIKEAMNS